ncbi:MAG: L-seryl-tRNA(Sec) selenium transferase [Candidatus Tectomicrobia bacterium]|uniref:L-seryl-tRNA(Sec) selenium transferase n=1 Tax=Tectimicrobiota bacterium TaxID=2528274 RepID=A0A932FY59_UNCTE|nr:L-seryl-tRNA(Sec) selenium transferase [Candidatus Tectomicrobia bacterium]
MRLEQVKREQLRSLPSVDELLQKLNALEGPRMRSHQRMVASIREVLEGMRRSILQADTLSRLEEIDLSADHLLQQVRWQVAHQESPSLKRVINATGIILHTNLGRALLPQAALAQMVSIGQYYSNLEYDLPSGERGSRHSHVEGLLRRLTGAEAALVVNNNAAAVLLSLDTLAQGREVIVSRGQLVEIGGSFRIPDILKTSGGRLVEVGTTNKTRLEDYRAALTPETALLLKVHTSNFRVVGFTAEVSGEELVALGRQHGLPVVEDLGSGNFIDLTRYGLSAEPTVQEVIQDGVDLVTFSGDKLLGGPQAGVILGRRDLVGRIKKNPLTRALRIDKLTLAALESTLRLYLDEEMAVRQIPTLRMLTLSPQALQERCELLLQRVHRLNGQGSSGESTPLEVRILDEHSQAGGGSLPLEQMPTRVLALRSSRASSETLERLFRDNEPPILGRLHKDCLYLDLRTVQEEEEEELLWAIDRVIQELGRDV